MHKLSGFLTEDGKIIAFDKEISAARFNEVVQAKQVCLTVVAVEEKFQLLAENFSEWESELLKQSLRYALWSSHHEAMDERLALDRRFLNLLSAARLYLDQADHALSSCCRNDVAVAELKRFKNSLYDSLPSFRLMEALRNYVQHRGLAIHSITYSNAGVWTEDGLLSGVSVKPRIHSEELRRDSHLSKKVLADLSDRKSEFDVRADVRSYLGALTAVHSEFTRLVAPRLESSRLAYASACEEFLANNGKTVDFAELVCVSGEQESQHVHLTTEFLERLDKLQHDNSRFGKNRLECTFIHSATANLPSDERAMAAFMHRRAEGDRVQ